VGLIVAGGQNAAFPGDTFALHTWLSDSGGAPLGVRPTDVSWTSSEPPVVEHVGDSLFVARSLGRSTVLAEVTVDGTRLTATREFRVIAPLEGRLAWSRHSGLLQPARLAWRDLSSKAVVSGPSFGHRGAPHGNAALSPDGRTVAVQATRAVSEIADNAVYLIDLSTNAVAVLTDSMPGNQIAPRWRADGSEVLFASNADGRWNIWSMPPQGGQPRVRLRLDAPEPVTFDVSRADGGVVVRLTDVRTRQDHLWEAMLEGGLVRQITGTQSTSPRVSPDGETIAYTGTTGDPEVVSAALVVPRVGGTPRELLPRIRVPVFPTARTNSFIAPSHAAAWTGDGAFVLVTWFVDAAYVRASGGGGEHWMHAGEIYAVSVDGRLRVRLTSWPWGDVQVDIR
jgi:hypothetical protein